MRLGDFECNCIPLLSLFFKITLLGSLLLLISYMKRMGCLCQKILQHRPKSANLTRPNSTLSTDFRHFISLNGMNSIFSFNEYIHFFHFWLMAATRKILQLPEKLLCLTRGLWGCSSQVPGSSPMIFSITSGRLAK